MILLLLYAVLNKSVFQVPHLIFTGILKALWWSLHIFFHTVEGSANTHILENSSRRHFKVDVIQTCMLLLVVSNPKEVTVTSSAWRYVLILTWMTLKFSVLMNKVMHKSIIHAYVGRKALFSFFKIFTIHGKPVFSLFLSLTQNCI